MLNRAWRLAVTTAVFAASLATISPVLAGDVYVNGYTKKDGTYVQPHYRSSPNQTRLDNYSTQGNTNPYTGSPGTVPQYSNQDSYKRYGTGNGGYGYGR